MLLSPRQDSSSRLFLLAKAAVNCSKLIDEVAVCKYFFARFARSSFEIVFIDSEKSNAARSRFAKLSAFSPETETESPSASSTNLSVRAASLIFLVAASNLSPFNSPERCSIMSPSTFSARTVSTVSSLFNVSVIFAPSVFSSAAAVALSAPAETCT